jgi:hypothetical protein
MEQNTNIRPIIFLENEPLCKLLVHMAKYKSRFDLEHTNSVHCDRRSVIIFCNYRFVSALNDHRNRKLWGKAKTAFV